MKPVICSLIILTAFAACSSRSYNDDKKDPFYASGNSFPVTRRPDGTPGQSAESRSNTTVVGPQVGLLAEAISLAFNRDYYANESYHR